VSLTCSTHEETEKCLRDFYLENINESRSLRDLDVDVKTVLKFV
jgi:hypothetical protein